MRLECVSRGKWPEKCAQLPTFLSTHSPSPSRVPIRSFSPSHALLSYPHGAASAAASAKRGARPRAAAPNPNPAPVAEPGESKLPRWMLHELRYGSLRQIDRLVEEAQRGEGVGALHYAARHSIIPVCMYLVEDVGVDVDAFDDSSAYLPLD